MWRAEYEHVIGSGGGHNMQRATFWSHMQGLGYRNIKSHITDGPGERWSKTQHNDLTSTHQNTIDSKISLRGSRSNYIMNVYAIENWIKQCIRRWVISIIPDGFTLKVGNSQQSLDGSVEMEQFLSLHATAKFLTLSGIEPSILQPVP